VTAVSLRGDVAQVSLAPVLISEDAGAERWDAYVRRHPDGTVEHLWGWREVFARAFGHDCVYLAAERDGAVVGVLPLVRYRSVLFGRFLVSLPYFNYAGVLVDDPAVAGALLERATTLAREHGARHVELRHRERQFTDLPARQNKLGFARGLPATADELWTGLDRKIRNQVRKAQKEGLTTDVGGDALIGEFYRVFAENMRDLGTPVFPHALFSEGLRQFERDMHVFVVRHRGQAVAGGIALTMGDTVLVPWASSLRGFRNLSPNTLLYWSMMEWASERGLRVFDFGRSSPGGGTQQFKEQWGGKPRHLYTEYLMLKSEAPPDQGTTNGKMARAIACWQRLPLPIANRVGPMIIRHFA
jgi:serine/alanine adding enzyme